MVFHGALETGYTIFAIAAWLGRHLHLRLVPQGRPLGLLRRADARRSRRSRKASRPIVLPDPGPGRPVHPVRRLQQAAPDAVHPAHPRRPRRGRARTWTSPRHALAVFNPIALISIGCLVLAFLLHLYGFLKGGRKAYLASEPVHNLPGRPPDLRPGRAAGLRPLRAGHQGPAGAVARSCSRASTGPSTSSSRRSSPSAGADVHRHPAEGPQRPLRELPGLVPGRLLVIWLASSACSQGREEER